jgi:HAD superfamily hydrolase (TIGR01509 family)
MLTQPEEPAMALKALIFDVDGTLAETETLHLKAMNASFSSAGLPWRWHPTLYRELLRIPGGRNRLRVFLAGRLPKRNRRELDDLANTLHADKDRRYRALLASGALDLRPGVHRLIGEARAAGLRLAVATATSRSNLEALLRNTCGAGAMGWFEVLCTVEDAPNRKPSPDAYLEVLRRLDLTAEACLAIEDSEPGVRAAKAAGLPVIVTQNKFTEKDRFEGAVAVLSDLGEPDEPCQHIRVPISGGSHVDVAQLRDWHHLALRRKTECAANDDASKRRATSESLPLLAS